MRHTASMLVGLFVLFACVRVDAGTIVFTNLGQPGDTYGPDGIAFGNNPFFPPSPSTGIVATRFYVTANTTMDSVETALSVTSGPPDFYAYILDETAGLPDQVMSAVHFTNVATGPQGPLLTDIPFPDLLLMAGTPYWFGLSAGASTFADWSFTPFYGDTNGSPNLGVGQISGDMTSNWTLGIGGPLGREGAFRVISGSVPEPAYALLVLAALLCLAGSATKYRK